MFVRTGKAYADITVDEGDSFQALFTDGCWVVKRNGELAMRFVDRRAAKEAEYQLRDAVHTLTAKPEVKPVPLTGAALAAQAAQDVKELWG
jgi:hypothetical protein